MTKKISKVSKDKQTAKGNPKKEKTSKFAKYFTSKGISMDDIAKKTDLSRNCLLSLWKGGNSNLSSIKLVSLIYEVDILKISDVKASVLKRKVRRDYDKTTFTKFRLYCLKNGISQEDIMDETFLSKGCVHGMWNNGKSSTKSIKLVSLVFNIDEENLREMMTEFVDFKNISI
jgi:hypothetical protein